MIPLTENSSKVCTFGRYRFLRLPFGTNAASEYFHSEMVKLFGDINGLIIYINNFLIHFPVEGHKNILERQNKSV